MGTFLSPGRIFALALVFYTIFCAPRAEAGPGACWPMQRGSQAWQTCQIDLLAPRVSDQEAQIQSLTRWVDDLHYQVLDLTYDRDTLARENAALEERLAQVELDLYGPEIDGGFGGALAHLDRMATAVSGATEYEDSFSHLFIYSYTPWPHERFNALETTVYGIPDTDYGGMSTWLDMLTYHVTGESGYRLEWGPTVPEQLESVWDEIDGLWSVCAVP
jgi:hypothetical protein